MEPRNSVLSSITNGRRFGMGSNMAFTALASQFLNKGVCRIADMFRYDVPRLDIPAVLSAR